MATNWTSEQKTVIDLRDCNILVSAAAGSGKTAVLVERILSLLMDERHPAEIDRMLIVTFTNAAAGEMRDRIRERLEEKLEEELEPEMMEHLQRQSALLQNAQISTIHSFCQYVIRNYFHTIDLDPDFRIADDGEQKLLQSDVLEQLLEEKYAEKSEAFLYMVESIATGRDDRVLESTVLQLYHFSMSFPWPQEWLDQCRREYEAENVEVFLDMPWIAELVKVAKVQVGDLLQMTRRALELCQEEHGPYMYEEALLSDLDMLEQLQTPETYRELGNAVRSMGKWKTLSAKRDEQVDPQIRDTVKGIREEVKKNFTKIRDTYFYAPPEALYEQMKRCRPMMEQLLDLTKEFADRYTQEKRKRNLCDFNDLEHLALQILMERKDGVCTRTQAARDLADYYQHIMIDEYQDSNLVQEMILTGICGEPEGIHNLFMVGDVKQSIYRFRLARPELFMEKYETYDLQEGSNRRIDLHKNFRSRAQVLESTNEVFDKIMDRDLGKVAYDEAARLYPGAVFEEAPDLNSYGSEMLLLDLADNEESEETDRELEARMIGRRILELMQIQKVWDKNEKSYRPIQFGDIVILLRTVTGWAEDFARVLGNMGIPVFAGARSGYFSAPEVQTVLALLKVIDNPCQDIPLTSVLYSPIGKKMPQQLAELKGRGEGKAFYQVCMEAEELRPFFAMLEQFRKKAVYTPMQELLWEILDETGYLDYVTAMPGGRQRRANLDMLVEKAAAYEAGSYHGLYHFVRYIENLHKYEIDFGEAMSGGEESHMVRIMSIHKSKGLEFPVVFVAGMGKNLNQTDSTTQFVTHMDLGIGCDDVDPILRVSGSTLFKNFVKMQIRNENLGEELRVLYVALTRAKEKLIITGAADNLEKKLVKWSEKLQPWQKKLSFTDRVQAKCDLDWMMPVILNEEAAPDIAFSVCTVQELLEGEVERQSEYLIQEQELLGMPSGMIFDPEAKEELETSLAYRYPYEKEETIPSKVSVSELKRMSQKEEESESVSLAPEAEEEESAQSTVIMPKFLQEETEVSGAGRGTVYHKVMEKLDFDCDAEEQMRKLCSRGIVTEKELECVNPLKIAKMCATSLGRRMAQAQRKWKLFREQQFVLELPAGEVNPKWSMEEQILVQGIIDAYFIEEDQIVLVDYKTDFVKFKEASSLYEKYRVQLGCYKKALESLTGYPVKEQIIYSFCLDRELTGSE